MPLLAGVLELLPWLLQWHNALDPQYGMGLQHGPAEKLNRKVTGLGPTRNQLISKGMIYSASHGDAAFTVPLFDEFMRRIMPGSDWKE